MDEKTISTASSIGKRLDGIVKGEQISFLSMDKEKIPLAGKITIGRATDNSVVIGGMLASRYHALIQRIKDDYFIKDLGSTNGTLINGETLPPEKYRKLESGDRITIGKTTLQIG